MQEQTQDTPKTHLLSRAIYKNPEKSSISSSQSTTFFPDNYYSGMINYNVYQSSHTSREVAFGGRDKFEVLSQVLTPSEIKVQSILILCKMAGMDPYFAQETIGGAVGICVRTVGRSVRSLKNYTGMLTVVSGKKYYRTNLYLVHRKMFTKSWKKTTKKFLATIWDFASEEFLQQCPTKLKEIILKMKTVYNKYMFGTKKEYSSSSRVRRGVPPEYDSPRLYMTNSGIRKRREKPDKFGNSLHNTENFVEKGKRSQKRVNIEQMKHFAANFDTMTNDINKANNA